jgi:antitoxin ParD1/3/4
MPTQNVNLTPALDSFVKEQITKGYFNNASEVHRAALAAMAKEEEERLLRLERLRAEVQVGLDAYEAGDFVVTNNEQGLDELLEGCFEKAMKRFDETSGETAA